MLVKAAAWYGWTLVYNFNNKEALMTLDSGFVTAFQISFATLATVLSGALFDALKVAAGGGAAALSARAGAGYRGPSARSVGTFAVMLAVMSAGQFLGNHFGNVAATTLSVSAVNIFKSSEPVLTVAMMFLLFGQRQPAYKLALTVPIIVGICLCNLTETGGDTLVGALMCTLSNLFHVRAPQRACCPLQRLHHPALPLAETRSDAQQRAAPFALRGEPRALATPSSPFR